MGVHVGWFIRMVSFRIIFLCNQNICKNKQKILKLIVSDWLPPTLSNLNFFLRPTLLFSLPLYFLHLLIYVFRRVCINLIQTKASTASAATPSTATTTSGLGRKRMNKTRQPKSSSKRLQVAKKQLNKAQNNSKLENNLQIII